MNLTKKQVDALVWTIVNQEQERLKKKYEKNREDPRLKEMVNKASKELEKLSPETLELMYEYNGKYSIPSSQKLEQKALSVLKFEPPRLPSGFKDEVERKIHLASIDSGTVEELKKKLGYNLIF